MLTAFDSWRRWTPNAAYRPDIVLYDILDRPSCAAALPCPLREGFADKVVIVTSGEKMALLAAAQTSSWRCATSRTATMPNWAGWCSTAATWPTRWSGWRIFAREMDTAVIGEIPRDPAIHAFEEQGRTIVEGDPSLPTAQRFFQLARTVAGLARRPRRSLTGGRARRPPCSWSKARIGIKDLHGKSDFPFAPWRGWGPTWRDGESSRPACSLPESVCIMAGPSALPAPLGVHGPRPGFTDRFYMLCVSELDMTLGQHLAKVEQGVLAIASRRPEKVVFLIVGCPDYILGTDFSGAIERLEAALGKRVLLGAMAPHHHRAKDSPFTAAYATVLRVPEARAPGPRPRGREPSWHLHCPWPTPRTLPGAPGRGHGAHTPRSP
jgi:hypothetical protein